MLQFLERRIFKKSIVYKKVINKPNRLVKDHKFNIKNYMANQPKIDFFSSLECLLIQSRYVKGGILKILKKIFLF